jgi:hypothetical protein
VDDLSIRLSEPLKFTFLVKNLKSQFNLVYTNTDKNVVVENSIEFNLGFLDVNDGTGLQYLSELMNSQTMMAYRFANTKGDAIDLSVEGQFEGNVKDQVFLGSGLLTNLLMPGLDKSAYKFNANTEYSVQLGGKKVFDGQCLAARDFSRPDESSFNYQFTREGLKYQLNGWVGQGLTLHTQDPKTKLKLTASQTALGSLTDTQGKSLGKVTVSPLAGERHQIKVDYVDGSMQTLVLD